MQFNFLGKAVKAVKNVVTPNHKNKDGTNLLLNRDNTVPKKHDFGNGQFASIGRALKRKNYGLGQLSKKLSQNKVVKKGNVLQETMLCAQVAFQATPYKLPKTFIGDMGDDCVNLIRKTLIAKNLKYTQSNPTNYKYASRSVTSFEVWNYICDNKNTPGHFAQRFVHLTEDQVRQLPGEWLDLQATDRSISKCVLECGAFNSPEHMYYFNMIGLFFNNIELWLPRIFEDRIRLEIHSYQIYPDDTLRITHEVPILLGRSRLFKNKYKIFASDLHNFFTKLTNIVSSTIVTEFTYDKTTLSYDKKSGTLITAFLHNLPYKNDAIDALLNVGPNNYYWGGSRGVAKKYLKSVGILGMPDLPGPGPICFQHFNQSSTPAGKQIEAQHKNGLIETQVLRTINLMGNTIKRWVTQSKNQTKVDLIQTDPGHISKIGVICGPTTSQVNQNYAQRLAILRKNNLV